MSAQHLSHACSGALMDANSLPTQEEGRALVGDGGSELSGVRRVDGDVVLRAHRLLADVIGLALCGPVFERQELG